MVSRNRHKMKIPDPRKGINRSQLTRPNPTIDRMGAQTKEEMDLLITDYLHFIDGARIAPEVVEEVISRAEKKGYTDDMRQDTFYITDFERTAFALIRKGRRPLRDGVRIIYAHNDSVALRTKPNSALLEWDPDEQPLHTGVEIDTFPYGGISPHKWTGRNLELRGWSVINGRKRKIKLPVHSADISAHTDDRSEKRMEYSDAHTEESIDLSTGFANVNDLLTVIGMKERQDFCRACIFAVPTSKPQR